MAHQRGLVDIVFTSGGRLSASDFVTDVDVKITGIASYRKLVSSTAHAYSICSLQSINGNYATVSTDEQSKKYSAIFSVTAGKINTINITYDVTLPIEYMATGCIKANTKSSGKWVIDTENRVNTSTKTSSAYYFSGNNLTNYFGPQSSLGSGILCNDNKTYHFPSKQEFVSIIPCTLHLATSPTLWDYSGQETETEIRFGAISTDRSYTSYWAADGKTMYAIRFVGTIYCSAWRYECESAVTGGGMIIKVKYLGKNVTTSNAASYLNTVKASGYNWSSTDVVVRLLPGAGFSPSTVGEGYTTSHSELGNRVRYTSITSDYTANGNSYYWEFLVNSNAPWAYIGDANAWHGCIWDGSGRTLRLWLDPNQL